MGIVIRFTGPHYARSKGRGTPEGQSALEGQLSENHWSVRSSRRDWMSDPVSSAPSFLVSPMARQLTVDSSKPSRAAKARATVNSCSTPVMHTSSVNLPRMSSSNLPNANGEVHGYATGVDLRALLSVIDELLAQRQLSDHAASKKAGVPDAIRNIRRAAKGEFKSLPTVRTLKALAKALECPPQRLLEAADGIVSGGSGTTLDRLHAKRAQMLNDLDALERVIELMEQQLPNDKAAD